MRRAKLVTWAFVILAWSAFGYVVIATIVEGVRRAVQS